MVKKCNDFGAGGVSVAIGELADGLQINLDKVPKKYAGLDGTEIAISESQERMAVVVDPKHAGTIDVIVDDKMKVLSGLCVVDNKDYDSVRAHLIAEIKNHPDIDMQRMVDRIARTMIYEKFNKD